MTGVFMGLQRKSEKTSLAMFFHWYNQFGNNGQQLVVSSYIFSKVKCKSGLFRLLFALSVIMETSIFL